MKVQEALKILKISQGTLYNRARNYISKGEIPNEIVEHLEQALTKKPALTMPQKLEEIHREILEMKTNTPNLKHRIIEKMQVYMETYHTPPSKVYLTQMDEYELLKLNATDIGYEAVSAMYKYGPRVTEKILGLQIVWDAEEFAVGSE
jgi:hypothetical protein